jgi:hypothetical protein
MGSSGCLLGGTLGSVPRLLLRTIMFKKRQRAGRIIGLFFSIAMGFCVFREARQFAAAGSFPLSHDSSLMRCLVILFGMWWPQGSFPFFRNSNDPFTAASVCQGSERPEVNRRSVVEALAWLLLFAGGSLWLAERAGTAAHLAASASSQGLVYAYGVKSLEFFAFVCIWMVVSPTPLPARVSGNPNWTRRKLAVRGTLVVLSGVLLLTAGYVGKQSLSNSSLSVSTKFEIVQGVLIWATIAVYVLAVVRLLMPVPFNSIGLSSDLPAASR